MAHHRLGATPETVRIGMFDAAFPPVMTVASGDTIEIETVSGWRPHLPAPDSGLEVPQALRAIIDADPPRMAGHTLTGPVEVEGARPGDMLEVRIDAVELGADWGYTFIRPLDGALPEEFPDPFISCIPIDRARGVAHLPWGIDLPTAPFFGVMGVAPPGRVGRISSKEPRAHGGNIDNKALVAGSRLFLPVHVPGALFCAGDGHGLQGDGEVCVTALETCLTGRFTLILHEGGGPQRPLLRHPRAETPSHFITLGMAEDLDQALRQALREMIDLICANTNLSREQAYQTCSLAADFHVTQAVNGQKGIHGMLRKGLLA
jgi:acetamidase/formamidase